MGVLSGSKNDLLCFEGIEYESVQITPLDHFDDIVQVYVRLLEQYSGIWFYFWWVEMF